MVEVAVVLLELADAFVDDELADDVAPEDDGMSMNIFIDGKPASKFGLNPR